MGVGIIGLGIMGGAYARNLILNGVDVKGIDPSADAQNRLTDAGGTAYSEPGPWLGDCDLIILSLLSPTILHSVASRIAPFLSPRQIVLETGTFALADKEAAAAMIAHAGGILLDCPVSGTGSQAANGDLLMMASGPGDAIEAARPFIAKFTRAMINCGSFGNGTKMKFVANHAVAVHNVAAAETLNFADTLGLDRDMVFDMLSNGAGQSKMTDLRMPLMISGAYSPPSASMKMFEKDLRVIGDDIARSGAFAPLFEATRSVYNTAFDTLPHDIDTAAVFEVFKSGNENET